MNRSPPGVDGVEALRHRLLAFFHRTRTDRAMPWRETDDPYAIWVSEVMLQQTRVETVIPYYRAWMECFPDVEALAGAAEKEVLKRWEGLGYYSRARNLHRAAQLVRERHGGRLPDRMDELRDLPGVGPYTAGAVGSIAFGLPVPAVDGNVRRVVARLLDLPDPSPGELERIVGEWVPREAPGDFNQALMELGATVCLPRDPGCGGCPVAELCRARESGTVEARPVPKRRARVRKSVEVVTVAVREGSPIRLALRRRPDTGLLAGMWEFPSRTASPQSGDGPAETLPLRVPPDREHQLLPDVVHAFTHLRVTYRPVLVHLPPGSPPPVDAEWFTLPEVRALPLPVAQQSIVESAVEALGAAAPAD